MALHFISAKHLYPTTYTFKCIKDLAVFLSLSSIFHGLKCLIAITCTKSRQKWKHPQERNLSHPWDPSSQLQSCDQCQMSYRLLRPVLLILVPHVALLKCSAWFAAALSDRIRQELYHFCFSVTLALTRWLCFQLQQSDWHSWNW